MRHSAVYACVNLIADTVSRLPVDIYTKRGTSRIEVEPPSIVTNPSAYASPTAWRRQMVVSWLLSGNTFCDVLDRDNNFLPSQLEILDPTTVNPEINRDTGELEFRVRGEIQPKDKIQLYPGLMVPGSPLGITPITYAAGSITLGLQAQHAAQEYYTHGTKFNGILSFLSRLKPGEAQDAKERFVSKAQNPHEPVVLSGDVKYIPLTISPQDSKYLETTQSTVQDVARYFMVPPERIGSESGKSMTYSTIEGNSRAFLQDLEPWIVRLEEVYNSLLIDGQYAKINRNAALSVDLMARYNAYSLGIRSGFLCADEVRGLEDLEELPDGEGKRYMYPAFAFGQIGQEEPIGQK